MFNSIVVGESLTLDEFMNLQECANLHIEYDEGQVFNVVPVSGAHASVHSNLMIILSLLLGSKNTVVSEPYGLKTGENSYLLPDIQVINGSIELPDNYYTGVPALIVEILSKSTAKRDTVDKLAKYRSIGVGEYWLVDPANKRLSINLLRDKEYLTYEFANSDVIRCGIMTAIGLPVGYIFWNNNKFDLAGKIMEIKNESIFVTDRLDSGTNPE
jgi:Uma2 family endonuclease